VKIINGGQRRYYIYCAFHAIFYTKNNPDLNFMMPNLRVSCGNNAVPFIKTLSTISVFRVKGLFLPLFFSLSFGINPFNEILKTL